MRQSPWIISVGPKGHYMCPYKKDAREDSTSTQKKRDMWRSKCEDGAEKDATISQGMALATRSCKEWTLPWSLQRRVCLGDTLILDFLNCEGVNCCSFMPLLLW